MFFSKIYDYFGLNKISHSKLMQMTTHVAILMSVFILGIKLLAYKYTCSCTLWTMILDSCFDISISFINFLIIKYTSQSITEKMRYSYDKIASIAAIIQGCLLISMLCNNIFGVALFGIGHTHSHDAPNNVIGLLSIVAATILCIITISIQKYTFALTRSSIIEADMMHYTSDLLSNSVVFISLSVEQFYHIHNLDYYLSVVISLYLLKGASKLILSNLKILLDYREHNLYTTIEAMLIRHNIDYKNLFVTYSGVRKIITCDVLVADTQTMEEINMSLHHLVRGIITILHKQPAIIKLTPVTSLSSDLTEYDREHVSCCHLHAH